MGINFVGGTLVSVLKLPIFLDTIGTILVALLAGPWFAALTGLVTNLVLVVSDPTLIAFVPVNVAIGLIAGFLALRGWFKTYPKIVASGLIMLTGVIVSAPIVVLAFGGVTSSPSSPVRWGWSSRTRTTARGRSSPRMRLWPVPTWSPRRSPGWGSC